MLEDHGPILADGAMGTMLFANGLQFGDPPEVWNLAHPDIVRRIQRGYLEAGSRILLTNTFGGNRLRLGLHGLSERVDELNRTAAILARAEVNAAGGTRSSPATSGPAERSSQPLGTLDYEIAVDVFREQAASLAAGGVDLDLDRDDVRPQRDEGSDRGRPAGRARHRPRDDDDVRHPRSHDDGRLAGAGRRGDGRVGRRRGRRELRQRAGRAGAGDRADARRRPGRGPGREVERRDARARRHARRVPGRPRHRWPRTASSSTRRAPGSSAPAAAARPTTSARCTQRSPPPPRRPAVHRAAPAQGRRPAARGRARGRAGPSCSI